MARTHRKTHKYQQPVYAIEYETRPELGAFLEDPSGAQAEENIDYYHIAQAMTVIEAWFAEHESEVEAIKDSFLNKVKVIWFELSSAENPVAAFTRLNVGKIPLTNAELIRALFLRSASNAEAEARRLRIAYEWDLVEKTLQAPAFWAFVANDMGRGDGRIDFLFSLAARQQGMAAGVDEYSTFNHFSQRLARKDADPAGAWLDVKRICMLLEEWFADRQLYHLAGFLIWHGMDVNELRGLAAGKRKSELTEKLRTEVVKCALGTTPPAELDRAPAWISDQLDGVMYPYHRRKIRAILLLFNLSSLLQYPQSNIRFNFEAFKEKNWDIEHVRSVASTEIRSSTEQVEWLRQTLRYLELLPQAPEAVELRAMIRRHLELPPKEGVIVFEPLYARLLQYFHEDDIAEPDNSIANLTLLDQETNRSYKNAVFPVKRQRVIELDAHGVFVPHCTRNVFLKTYSPLVGHAMYWTPEDRDGYRQHLIDTLSAFVTGGRANA